MNMEKVTDGPLTVVVAGPVGFGNNIYIVIDRETGEAACIDAPGDAAASIEAAEFGGVRPSKILLTHSHGDHTSAIDGLKEAFGCQLYANPKEPWLKPGQIDTEVAHGDEVSVGNLVFQAIAVPGHTPGSTTYLWGKHAFVGDTLFPGGPGRSVSNEALQEEIASITNRLYPLPGDTVIYPGHGAQSTIEVSRAEYAVFAAKEHSPGLHGDVSWLES